MTQPDLILPLDPKNPSGPEAWVWIEASEITRQGSRGVVGIPQLEDKWRVSLPLRASLAIGGELVRDANGNEVPTTCPVSSPSCDLADIIYDPQVQQLIALHRDVCMRLVSGDLNPVTPKDDTL